MKKNVSALHDVICKSLGAWRLSIVAFCVICYGYTHHPQIHEKYYFTFPKGTEWLITPTVLLLFPYSE